MKKIITPDELDSTPPWVPPGPEFIKKTHIAKLMAELNLETVKALHTWTVASYPLFWQCMLKKLNIIFHTPPEKICDLTQGIETPIWFSGAKLNIVNSCFNAAKNKTALLFKNPNQPLKKMSYAELDQLSNQVATSLTIQGFKPTEAIAIIMPMTCEAVAIYLGIIKMGGCVVSIADSFSSHEIAQRLCIAKTKAVFTQDFIHRDEKKLPLYEKIVAATSLKTIILPSQQKIECNLRPDDSAWQDFLINNKIFSSYLADPMAHCNILFSSGTTAEPKAIPWNHTTAIKAASDGYLHQDIHPDDIITWPTNLGWMMGPWLIFAGLINQATIALYNDVPTTHTFGEFIQDANITILGLVPTLVAHWRRTHCMEKLNWNAIRLFSSTGECSNAEDMSYLMSLANHKPIIEYCGGTEIGGAYISSTLIEKNYPALFSTPAMGLDFLLLDEKGQPTENGEVALLPPSIGLSTELLNADHHEVYYANMPKTPDGKILRRHGDQIQHLANGYYSILGRVDDTMNLGGIKISSAEIERTLVGIPNLIETAAIAVNPEKRGASQLIIFAVTKSISCKDEIKKQMQQRINQHLNPLFKIHDVIFVDALPKTASNKIVRRILREAKNN